MLLHHPLFLVVRSLIDYFNKYRQATQVLQKASERGFRRRHLYQREESHLQQKGRAASRSQPSIFADFCFKIARYYDKYTAEIRASFERGTAL